MKNIEALLFDKDGTLFDFQMSYGAWTGKILKKISQDHAIPFEALADVIGLCAKTSRFKPGSPFVANTLAEDIELLISHFPSLTEAYIRQAIEYFPKSEVLHPVGDLPQYLSALRASNFKLGIATNDTLQSTLKDLAQFEIEHLFDHVFACDSGYGAKPGSGMLAAFAEATGVDPSKIAMIGDSTHDLIPARAIGMYSIGVLTGVASHEQLLPYSDLILPNILMLSEKLLH